MPWPLDNTPGDEKTPELTWWTVKTYHKKNCEQREIFLNREHDGRVIVTDGFRWVTYNVATDDGKFPDFEFTTVPGGDDKKDSLDLNNLCDNNIVESELVEMFDGGCWGDTEVEGIDDEEEVERIQELISEEGSYALEEDGDGDWFLDETEVWVWGPLEVSNEDGSIRRIIIADAEGNVLDFDEDAS